LALVCLVACACVARPPLAASTEPLATITLRMPGDLRQATWTGSRIFGATIDIVRDEDTYRGRVLNAPVDLRTGDAVVEGTRGGPTELHLETHSDGFTVRGLNGGKLGSLEVRADRIVGQLGGCQYELRAALTGSALYQGARVCGARPEPTELSLPSEMVALPPEHRAALLAIFLGP
jgi:hypothetical protein